MSIITGGSVIEGAISRSATERSAVFEYDFAVDGGAIATISLRPLDGSPGTIPSGAVITDTVVEVLTVVTSGGAGTAALQVEAANDVVSATVVSGAPWSTTGRKAGIPVSAATSLKTTAARTPKVVIAAFTATAGKFRLYVSYYV